VSIERGRGARDELPQPCLGDPGVRAGARAQRRSAFINVLSVVSWVAIPLLSTYSASKAAAWSFTNAARVELKRQGTQVIGVHVGFVDTDLTALLEVEKIPPATVAASALDALQAGEPEALVDDFSRAVKSGLSDEPARALPAGRAGVPGDGAIGVRHAQASRRVC
jgi:NAD(P)-dependent dehydrogenase (short-subunit alcohol dehydrogenase family)